MASKTRLKGFDCVKWVREVRDRNYAETKDMSFEERKLRLEKVVQEKPFYAGIPKVKIPSRPSQERAEGS